MNNQSLLKLQNVTKRFPGVIALDGVSFSLMPGEVHALVGENGAGKSTLIKIISGVYYADSGDVVFEGVSLKGITPQSAIKHGISTVHQELKMVESLSVAENIFLGHPILGKSVFGKYIDWKAMREDARNFVHSLGIELDVDERVENLSVAQKQVVEICKALKREAKLIIMDEPSATLTQSELTILFKTIGRLKASGVSIIYISHRLEEVFEIADRVTVLRDGKTVVTDRVSNMDKAQLIKYMVGREIVNIYPPKIIRKGNELLEVKNLSRQGVLVDINFNLYMGEILGIAGLVGAGRTELVRALFGVDRIDCGEIRIKGESRVIGSVKNAIRNKIGYIPEERKLQGIISEFSVSKNISLVGAKKITKHSVISNALEEEVAEKFIKRLRITTPSRHQLIRDLSGGNQQKCVLAKWLFIEPDIILFDEPTRGIDIGAKQEIYKILVELAAQGKGIILISSELPEILGISHRLLVMHGGRITAELDGESATQEKVMHYATL